MMIRDLKLTIYKIATIIVVLGYVFHTSSCASTKAAPSGGPKDTLPPVVVSTKPMVNSVNFPLDQGEIFIGFNEYVQLKDAYKNVLLSPPQKKNIKTRIKGKGIVVSFQEPLDSNQTYSINFGKAIVDNNESNPLYGFSYSFSTGNEIDSMMFSGTVVDATSLFPIENVTVALYHDAKDSTVMTERPNAVAKTDKWGYFTLRNLKPGSYNIFAFTDENNNNMYDQGGEKIAFSDIKVTPVEVMRTDSQQLQYIDPKDTSACLSRPAEVQLALFAENPAIQFIKDYKRTAARSAYIKFNAQHAQIDSFSIKGMNDDMIIKQFNINGDSLVFWINDQGKIADTLHLGIKYHKSDSSGRLVPSVENLRLVAPFEKKDDKKKNDEKKDKLQFNISADNKMVEQNGIILQFKEPLILNKFDSISFIMSTPKQVKSNIMYTVEQDTSDMNKYVIRPNVQFVSGNEYTLTFPAGVFKDINGFTNDSTSNVIALPNNDNASSITLEVTGVGSRYIVELINETRNTVFRKYEISEDTELLFPYLEKGKYAVRITQDKNCNGLFDTGDLLSRKQPEKVLLYTLPDGSEIINLNEKTDLVQSVNIKELFEK